MRKIQVKRLKKIYIHLELDKADKLKKGNRLRNNWKHMKRMFTKMNEVQKLDYLDKFSQVIA